MRNLIITLLFAIVLLSGCQPKILTDTYWRNDATGDWFIGIAEEHVIYNSNVYDIVSQQMVDSCLVLTIDGGTTFKIGKDNGGQRTFVVNNTDTVVCSRIAMRALPEFPTKDERKGFVDNGYAEGDSVTIAGWIRNRPLWARAMSDEIDISISNIFTNEEDVYSAKMDKLGRFSLKMPLLNTSEAFIGWKIIHTRNVLEPGKSYFMLVDFDAELKLWMGDDVRLQNELEAIPWNTHWDTDRLKKDSCNEAEAMEYKVSLENNREKELKELQELVNKWPNISQRFIDFITGYFQMQQAYQMMQARFQMLNWQLPQEYMEYVGKELWQKAPKPYTLYRDFSSFMRDYLQHLEHKGKHIQASDDVAALAIAIQKGEIAVDAADYPTIVKWAKERADIIAKIRNSKTDAERDSIAKTFDSSELVHTIDSLINIKYSKEINTFFYQYNVTDLIDSVGYDQTLRDIYIARRLMYDINAYRVPLKEVWYECAMNDIQLPSAKNFLAAQQAKYVALSKGDTKLACIKSADDVADMTDGEKILHKIIEPYKGKLILLDVWGTWCGGCKVNLSHSTEEYEALKDLDIIYLYLANSSSDESWKNVIKEYNVTGDNVVHYNLPAKQQSAIENFLGVKKFPSYRIIDREGNILDVNASPTDLNTLKRLLQSIE
ncbi:MAG: thioredoxin family protein [Bacteroidales bacterium]|nr:thioredoxin family protein [Bacteroidales bacterium]